MSYMSGLQTVGDKGNENHPKLNKFNLNMFGKMFGVLDGWSLKILVAYGRWLL